jgi:hypothetical protein
MHPKYLAAKRFRATPTGQDAGKALVKVAPTLQAMELPGLQAQPTGSHPPTLVTNLAFKKRLLA